MKVAVWDFDGTLVRRRGGWTGALDRKAEFGAALGTWLSMKSFQGPEAVTRALVFMGQPKSAEELNADLGASWAGDQTDWTKKRHGMVHRAENPYVRRHHAKGCAALVERIVEVVDDQLP